MEKSRNNECVKRDSKQGLIAIEKNNNVLEKTKKQYIKRSIYSTNYIEYPIEETGKLQGRKNITDRKYSSLNFNKFSLVKSESTGNFPERNVLPSIKMPNMKKQTFRRSQDSRPSFQDLFLASKLNDNSASQSKNTAFKFSIDIDNLLTKCLKPKEVNKAKTSIDISKDCIVEQLLNYYDKELPNKYKSLIRSIIFKANFKAKEKKVESPSASSFTIKHCSFDQLLNTIIRKINVYNQHNQLIKQEEVVCLINREVDEHFRRSKMQFNKDENSQLLLNSQVAYYSDMLHNRQFIMNKLIKKKLNRSHDIHHPDKQNSLLEMIQNAEKGCSSNKEYTDLYEDLDEERISQIHLMLNSTYGNSSLYDLMFFSTSPRSIKPIKTKPMAQTEKEMMIKRLDKKQCNDDLDMTMRSFYRIAPKWVNDQTSHEKSDINHENDKASKASGGLQNKLIPNCSLKRNVLRAQAKSIASRQKRTNSQLNRRMQLNDSKARALRSSLQKNSSNSKTQTDNSSAGNYLDNVKANMERTKQLEIEEMEHRRLMAEKEKQEQREAERLELERLELQNERIQRQEEEYQHYVEMKKQEEQRRKLAKLEEERKSKTEEKPVKKEKFRNFYIVNKENQASLLSVLQPTNLVVQQFPFQKNIRFRKQEPEQKSVASQKDEHPSEKKLEKTEKVRRLSSDKFKIKKLPVRNEANIIASKSKREAHVLKVKQDVNYFLSDYKKLDHTDNDQMEELKEQISQSLINISNQLEAKDLSSKLDNIQEQIEDFKQGREDEKRINSFIKGMDNTLTLMKEKNRHFYAKYKVINNQPAYFCLTPIKHAKAH